MIAAGVVCSKCGDVLEIPLAEVSHGTESQAIIGYLAWASGWSVVDGESLCPSCRPRQVDEDCGPIPVKRTASLSFAF
jgi:hypothetical protein